MEARAYVRTIQMSPRKMRAVVNMIRGESVEKALGTLRLMPKKASRLIIKALESATANAEDKSGGEVDVDDLRVKTITVDNGPIVKRWLPRAMGRANRIQHRTSHLTVVVSDEA
jgi:large subunit ribosomal protein L22